MMFWRFISALYGLALIILGIILLITELASMSDTCTTIWGKLSQNQKLFFSDNKSNLEAERSKNVSMMGAFAIVLGFFLIVSGITQHYLYSESAVVSKPPSTSRLPPSDQHEKMHFVYFCFRGEDYDGPHMLSETNKEVTEEVDNEDPYMAEQREREAQRQE